MQEDQVGLATLAARVKAIEDANLDRRLTHVEQLAIQIRTVVVTVLFLVMAFGFGAKEMLRSLWAGIGQ